MPSPAPCASAICAAAWIPSAHGWWAAAPKPSARRFTTSPIIFLFALGAGLGSLALAPMGSRAIWLSCLLLFISFCLMFLKEDIEELEEFEHLEHEEALKK